MTSSIPNDIQKPARALIGLREVAAMVGGTHPEHVRRVLSKRSDFPAQFRIGTRVMFDRAEIASWIDAQRQQIGCNAAQPSVDSGGMTP